MSEYVRFIPAVTVRFYPDGLNWRADAYWDNGMVSGAADMRPWTAVVRAIGIQLAEFFSIPPRPNEKVVWTPSVDVPSDVASGDRNERPTAQDVDSAKG